MSWIKRKALNIYAWCKILPSGCNPVQCALSLTQTRVLLPDLKRLRSKVQVSNTDKGDGNTPVLLAIEN